MADFDAAMADLDAKEGGRINHPADHGGETFRGISRRFHPDWVGWAHLDRGDVEAANKSVAPFYRQEYWHPVGGAHIESQRIANELFEQAVHQRPRIAVMRLQRVLNCLNAQGVRWPDLKVDGRIGRKTLEALSSASRYEPEIWGALNALHLVYLLGRMEAEPTQEAFAVGWFRRALS